MASVPDRFRNAPPFADVADQLQALASELRSARSGSEVLATDDPPASSERAQFLEFARARYDARRRRSSIIGGSDLFGEPAWDILLDLYIAHGQGKPVSVSSACIGSASPPTTGLRWLGVLQESGLVEREHDPRDQRRVLVSLSADGVERMERYFREAMAIEAA